jgi:hypothetical protein
VGAGCNSFKPVNNVIVVTHEEWVAAGSRVSQRPLCLAADPIGRLSDLTRVESPAEVLAGAAADRVLPGE